MHREPERLLRARTDRSVPVVWRCRTVWLGNGGPCRLFLFRQGASKHPIDRPVDAEARIDPSRYSEFQLPTEFDLLGVCPSGHRVPAVGRCRYGVWCETDTSEAERNVAERDLIRRFREG